MFGWVRMDPVVETLRSCLLGWKAYLGMAQVPNVWRGLNKWLCHRLRALQLKHWKCPSWSAMIAFMIQGLNGGSQPPPAPP